MAKAKKLPSGNWRVLASKTINGKRLNKSFTAPYKKEAEHAAYEWQHKEKSIENGDILFSEAITFYIEKRKYSLSPVTIATYKGYQRRYLIDLQELYVKNITRNDLQEHFNVLAEKLSPKTIKSVYGFFSAVLKENNVIYNIYLPKVYRKIYNTPDREMSKKILEAVRGSKIEVPINLALRCGMRISEIRGLKFEKVKNGKLTVDNVIVRMAGNNYEKQPKSSAGVRTFPIPKDIEEMIANLPHDNKYVTTLTDCTINKHLREILQRNNLPVYTMHNLRHGFASAMAYLGIPEQYAMQIGGWETSDTMHKIYMQTFDFAKLEFSKKINNYFEEVNTNSTRGF